jgi:hypothetical protein
MSSLFSTLSMLPSHLTVEMSIALCVGMEMMVAIVETSISPLASTLISALARTLARTLAGEFTSEGIQHHCNGRPYYLTCPKAGNLRRGWSIIDRKHDAQRSTRSRFSLNLT